jgi:hypothetical protein
LRHPLRYALVMGLMTMAVVPSDIRLAWQWALGFIAVFSAALIAHRFRQRSVRVAFVAGGAAIAVAGLVFFYAPEPPSSLNANANIAVYTVVDTSRIVAQIIVATVIAFGVDLFLVPGKAATSSKPAAPVRKRAYKASRRRR